MPISTREELKSYRVDKRSITDGNCLFGAFILGVSHPDVLAKIDSRKFVRENAGFASAIAKALSVAGTWDAVTKKVASMRKSDPIELQRILAPVFRAQAVKSARADKDSINPTIPLIESAFHNHVLKKLGLGSAPVDDDYFKQHPFVKKKFEELTRAVMSHIHMDAATTARLKLLRSKKDQLTPSESAELTNLEANHLDQAFADSRAKETLRTWWASGEGYNTFLTEMAKPGQFAGDLEVQRLARELNVRVAVFRGDGKYFMSRDDGAIPCNEFTDPRMIAELAARNVFAQVPEAGVTAIQLGDLGQQQIKARVLKVGKDDNEYVAVTEFIKANSPIDRKVVPSWSEQCLAELCARNVIYRHPAAGVWVFSALDTDTALARVGELPDYAKFLSLYEKYKIEQTEIVLRNPTNNSQHWECLEKVAGRAAEYPIYNGMLTMLGRKITYNESEWVNAKEKAFTEADEIKANGANEPTVIYDFGNGVLKDITVSTQKALDRLYATKVQYELQQAESNDPHPVKGNRK